MFRRFLPRPGKARRLTLLAAALLLVRPWPSSP